MDFICPNKSLLMSCFRSWGTRYCGYQWTIYNSFNSTCIRVPWLWNCILPWSLSYSCNSHIMVYKGHLYKGHGQLFKDDKGQGLGSSKNLGTVFAYRCKRHSVEDRKWSPNFSKIVLSTSTSGKDEFLCLIITFALNLQKIVIVNATWAYISNSIEEVMWICRFLGDEVEALYLISTVLRSRCYCTRDFTCWPLVDIVVNLTTYDFICSGKRKRKDSA